MLDVYKALCGAAFSLVDLYLLIEQLYTFTSHYSIFQTPTYPQLEHVFSVSLKKKIMVKFFLW